MEYQCKICCNDVIPINVKQNKEEWGIEVLWECPICTSEHNGDTVTNRAEGERCDNCGEFVEEYIEVNFTGEIQHMCTECEEEFWV